MQQLWEILVPKETNEGIEIPLFHHRAWDRYVQNISGGLTILKTATGIWQSPDGKVFREPMIPVRIACSEDHIRQIADFTARHYDQLAVMLYLVSEKVLFIERS